MSTVKIGVIGAGSISSQHLNAYAANPQADIIAICDLNEERARDAAARYGAEHVYTDYKELLRNNQIDAVSICTWNNSHAEISIAALEAGKDVLVEKPLCLTVEEALRVQETVRTSRQLLQVGVVRRYDQNAQLLRSMCEAGEFGDIYYARASYIRRHGNPGGWFSDKSRSGGGPLIDLGVHVIDLCWYLMRRPKPVTVSANTYRKLGNRAHIENLSRYKAADYDPAHNDVEDMANVMIRFENGASLVIDTSFTLHARQDEGSIKLYGDKGGFEIDPELSIITEKHDTIMNCTPQTDAKGFQFEQAFHNEINHFVSCVHTRTIPLSPVEDGVWLMKILEAAYRSAQLGKEVEL